MRRAAALVLFLAVGLSVLAACGSDGSETPGSTEARPPATEAAKPLNTATPGATKKAVTPSSTSRTPTPTKLPLAGPSPSVQQGNCSPAYPDVCIPPPPPDLDCKDVPYRRFRVLPPDPHRFDNDKDGVGCES